MDIKQQVHGEILAQHYIFQQFKFRVFLAMVCIPIIFSLPQVDLLFINLTGFNPFIPFASMIPHGNGLHHTARCCMKRYFLFVPFQLLIVAYNRRNYRNRMKLLIIVTSTPICWLWSSNQFSAASTATRLQ